MQIGYNDNDESISREDSVLSARIVHCAYSWKTRFVT